MQICYWENGIYRRKQYPSVEKSFFLLLKILCYIKCKSLCIRILNVKGDTFYWMTWLLCRYLGNHYSKSVKIWGEIVLCGSCERKWINKIIWSIFHGWFHSKTIKTTLMLFLLGNQSSSWRKIKILKQGGKPTQL